ncbi:MAG: oligoendopeptidase F [Ignavibacteria bacterium]|nr:oligoendopeptidase F [Ignavibacteria bacterium]MBT8382879.1 oligoendopeptidase F [Ignavibacteria bacterium]MBT8390457.1 oligoendopeptidase F [Ignavibacteria bacterium]NNJ52933.1 oligoendopeptidase F [Ignavibacteriaceae bacterium]NNL21368.1 oligoendopeptidase F [Ignavibacteriaceae bacterium]
MHKILLTIALLFFLTNNAFSQVERDQVEDKHKWNLADIYPSVEAWQADVDMLNTEVEKLGDFKGTLGESSESLYKALSFGNDLVKTLWQSWIYASNLSNENLNISENQALLQQMRALGTKFGEVTAYMEPEILQIPKEKIEQFFAEKPELADYDMYIDNIQRLREHTLTEAEEKILASFGLIAGNQNEVYGIFNNAEKPFPKVTLSTGEEVELTASAYSKYRTAENRADRELVMKSLFESYGDFKNMLGANLGGKVKKDWVYAKNRKYESSLEAALNSDNLPTAVYSTLIEQVNNNLPTLHRALDLKKRMLGLDELHYYDLYVPLVKKVDMSFTVEEGQNVLLDALKPLGNEYVTVLQKSYDDRWIDYIPTVGKRSGAYSTGGAYDVHPYILMNWTDDFESVSTLAHELGHTMHSYFSNKTQPFVKSDYATFVAEIASTVNENLLNDYMVANAKSDEEKLYILGSYLELLRTTIFRQTSFAEFEWEIHKKVEAGEPITGEGMCEIYFDIVKRYYGHDAGHCVVDDYIQYEWSYIPHFLGYNYYVFQYATSLIYGTALVENMMENGQPAVDAYYNILKGGGSKYSPELIKDAGIDPMSPEPVQLTMQKMNRVMDQMEEILGKTEDN